MKNRFYTPKWKQLQKPIPVEVIRSNLNLRRFVRIKKVMFAFNFIASIVLLTIIFTGVL